MNIADYEFWVSKIVAILKSKRFYDDLNSGNINDKNHIPSKIKFYYSDIKDTIEPLLLTNCEKCNTLFSINLNSQNEIILYHQSNNLTCEENIIKNIIE